MAAAVTGTPRDYIAYHLYDDGYTWLAQPLTWTVRGAPNLPPPRYRGAFGEPAAASGGPAAGAQYVAAKLKAIAANPDVWKKTAFLLTYDENDGYFDHVPPPLPPKGTDGEFVDGVAIGFGARVPMIVISP